MCPQAIDQNCVLNQNSPANKRDLPGPFVFINVTFTLRKYERMAAMFHYELSSFRRWISILIFCFAILTQNALAGSRSIGTTYLPLDHWAYPVIERAIAKGAMPSQFLGLRPWTRTAIAALLVERHEN